MTKRLHLALLFLLLPILVFAKGNKEVTDFVQSGEKTIIDSLGRQVKIPDGKVIPASASAQMYIYAISPASLASSAIPWPEKESFYIKSEVSKLPVTGVYNFYSSTLDIKAIKKSDASFILIVDDKANMEPGIALQLDELERETGKSIAYICDDFGSIPSVVKTIGSIFSCEERAEEVASLAEKFISPVRLTRNTVSVYYSTSVDGLTPVSPSYPESALINYMGLLNVVPKSFSGSYTIEEIVELGADKILLSNEKAYDEITTNPEWQKVEAVRNKEVYLVPVLPYNIISNPNSIQRLLGLEWLRMICYDAFSPEEMESLADEYLEKILGASLTPGQINDALYIH